MISCSSDSLGDNTSALGAGSAGDPGRSALGSAPVMSFSIVEALFGADSFRAEV